MACDGRALRASKLAACAGGAQGVRLLCGGIRSARTSHRAARGGAHFAPGIRLSHRGGWPLRVWAPEFWTFPEWGAGADVMFAEDRQARAPMKPARTACAIQKIFTIARCASSARFVCLTTRRRRPAA